MRKVVNFTHQIGNILLTVIVFSNIFYLLWLFLAKDIYWPTYSKVADIFQWIVFGETCLILPSLAISNFKLYIRLIALGLVVVISFFTLGYLGDPASYLNSTTLNDKTIILGQYGLHNGSNCYLLLECRANGTHCKETNPKVSDCTGDFEPNAMIIDETGNLNVFTNGILIYTYGAESYSYKFGDSAFYNEKVYWVVNTKASEMPFFVFGECDEETGKSCKIIQIYHNPKFDYMNLDTDVEGKELFIFLDGTLTYTLGNKTRRYDPLFSLETQHSLGDGFPSTYKISAYESNNKYHHILYECNASHFWCQILPYQYSTTEKELLSLKIDELKKELYVYKNDTLILTYGEHPRCYVEGCEILTE